MTGVVGGGGHTVGRRGGGGGLEGNTLGGRQWVSTRGS